MTATITRPGAGEYAPYYDRYIARVPEHDIVDTLTTQGAATAALLRDVPESRGSFRYAPGKWTLKEVLGHMSDAERVFAYRALRIGRGDTTPLASFEQDDYVRNTDWAARTVRDLAEELAAVRQATLHLFRHFRAAELTRLGTASEKPVSVRALGYIIAGHEIHHVEQLRGQYL